MQLKALHDEVDWPEQFDRLPAESVDQDIEPTPLYDFVLRSGYEDEDRVGEEYKDNDRRREVEYPNGLLREYEWVIISNILIGFERKQPSNTIIINMIMRNSPRRYE
uniref:Uncharacterized protein n=1 Tax=Trichogramma kaykai TaxID=54128 RepID=A0ABD2VZ61_9HYME